MSKYEKSNVVIVILVALLFILTSALVYFIYFNKPVEEKMDSIYTKVEDENIINEIRKTIIDNNLELIARNEKNVEDINTISNEDKLDIALSFALNEVKDPYTDGVDTKLFDEYFKNSFIGSIYWNKEDINCFCDKKLYLYDKENDKYIYNIEHLGHGAFSITPYYRNIKEVQKKNNTYVVKMQYIWGYFDGMPHPTNIGYTSYNDALNDKNKLFEIEISEQKISDIEVNALDANYYALKEIENNYDLYKDKLHTYIYTFEKENDKYLLSSFRFER